MIKIIAGFLPQNNELLRHLRALDAPANSPAKTTAKKHPVARRRQKGILYVMDWQKMAALSVVAATAGIFLRAKLRRRKFSFERDTHCGCSSANSTNAKTSIVFSARKGERAKIIMKTTMPRNAP
jgi:hypothetical protein